MCSKGMTIRFYRCHYELNTNSVFECVKYGLIQQIFNQAGSDKSSEVKYFRLVQKLCCGPDRYESNTVRIKKLSGWQKD